jgi:hypothetical protein
MKASKIIKLLVPASIKVKRLAQGIKKTNSTSKIMNMIAKR